MKKKFLFSLLIVIIGVSIVVFCNFRQKSGIMICTYRVENDVYKLQSHYEITYKENKVLNLLTKETFTSSDEKMLSEYKTSLELIYSKYQNLKYYENSINMKKDKLISTTNINYQKLDTKAFLKIDSNNRKLMEDGSISLKKIKKLYQENGFRCTYK